MRSYTTFGAFTVARMGIYAAQKGLEVTGQNIANINTTGYTRRVLDQISFSTGGKDRYQSMYDVNVGGGVLCTGVSQLRDPYLDIRFRDQNSALGAEDAKLGALEGIAGVLDEIANSEKGDGVLEKQLNDLYSKLNGLNNNIGAAENDSMVRSSAEALVELLHSYANRLETVRENEEKGLKESVRDVNSILTRIGELNESIRKSEIHGDKALDLRDQRNLELDKLSQYMKIDVQYKEEDVGAGITVERMVVKLAGNGQGNDTEKSVLVDGPFVTQIATTSPRANPGYDPTQPASAANAPYLNADNNPVVKFEDAAQDPNPDYGISLAPMTDPKGNQLAGSGPVTLGENDLYGALQSSREMLTKAGEFTVGGTTTERGIPYYQRSLDSLANKLAAVFNEANKADTPVYKTNEEGHYVDKDGIPLVDAATGNYFGGAYVDLSADQKALVEANGVRVGGALFTNGTADGTGGITAANIAISDGWSSGRVRIVSDWRLANGTAGSTDNENIAHLLSQFDAKQQFIPGDVAAGASGDAFFEGSFQEMLLNINSTLGDDKYVTSTLVTNYSITTTERDVARDSLSGVDLNDEAANLMTYQKSYAAACRLMTTIDEALDKLINGTGVVGR